MDKIKALSGCTKLVDELKIFDFVQLAKTEEIASYENSAQTLANYFKLKNKPHKEAFIA